VTFAQSLVPFPAALPLATGGLMLALGRWLPPRTPDIVAILVSLAVAAISGFLAYASRDGALVYWFGGWAPRDGAALGIGFGVDPVSATLASFVALLFAAAFIYAWSYFDDAA
jgi:multicomponent Na+:H+ antiporter subunit D